MTRDFLVFGNRKFGYKKLGQLQGIMETVGLTDKINDMMGKMKLPNGKIITGMQTKYKVLQSLKDDILALKAKTWIASQDVITQTAHQQKMRQLAQVYGRELYDTRKAIKTVQDNKTLSQIRKVDLAIRDVLNQRNPEYAKINKVFHYNSELKDLLEELIEKQGHKGWEAVLENVSTVGGGILGGIWGQSIPNIGWGIAAGYVTSWMIHITHSAWWNTLRAVQKSQLAEKLLTKPAEHLPRYLYSLLRLGPKYTEKFLRE